MQCDLAPPGAGKAERVKPRVAADLGWRAEEVESRRKLYPSWWLAGKVPTGTECLSRSPQLQGAMAASDGVVKEGLLEEVTGELSSEQ